jgi:FkbM family methyltransferase
MSSEIVRNNDLLVHALSVLGRDEKIRETILEALRQAELQAEDPSTFREQVRWPLILSLLQDVEAHRVVLENGLAFEITPDSRIEKALLLSSVAHPDHVWEPQTTKLLTTLAIGATNVIVGGAYIGDQVALVARGNPDSKRPAMVHAFEPMQHAFDRLQRHVSLNDLENVVCHRSALWSESNVRLRLDGHLALASSLIEENEPSGDGESCQSLSIDEYVMTHKLTPVELIMLDIEGGEEQALRGGRDTIIRDYPNVVFEIHRNFVDWSKGLAETPAVRFLTSLGYTLFAVRDFHNNYPTTGYPIELVPIETVYLDGPPHGFNVLAIRDTGLVQRLGLKIVDHVSPKLLLEKDPALHFPRFTS